MQYSFAEPRKKHVHLFTYSIVVYIILLPFDCFRVGSIGSLLRIYAFVPLILLFLSGEFTKLKYSSMLRAMVLYMLWAFITCYFSIDIDVSFSSFISLSTNMILVILLGSMHSYNEKEIQILLKAFIVSGWVMLFCFLFFGNSDNYAGRLVLEFEDGSSQDANYANGYMLCAFVFHIYKAIKEKRVIHFIAAAVMSSVVIMTGSRGALVAFVCCILFVIAFVIRNSNHKIRILLISIGVAVLLYYGFLNLLDQLNPVLASRFSEEYIREHGSTGRSEIWENLLGTFSKANIFRQMAGWGYGTTRLVNTTTGITTEGMVAHNLYIDNLISMGFIGALLQICMQIECMKVLFKSRNAMLVCAYGAFIIMCMSLSLVNYKPMWSVMMMALILGNSGYCADEME